MKKKSCEKSVGSAMSCRSLSSVCLMRKRMMVAGRQDRARHSCVAAGSQSGDAEELAAPLPASADEQTGQPMRAEGRGWRNSALLSPRQSPPLSGRREEERREGLDEFSGTTLFCDPCGNLICFV